MKCSKTTRILALSVLLAAGLATPAFAQVTLSINIGPPAPQYEMVPVVPPGYVWAPGYWARHDDRFIWVRGRSIVQRTGYRWEPDRWEQRGSTYYRHEGNWARDVNYKTPKAKKAKKSKHDGDNDQGRGKGGKHGR